MACQRSLIILTAALALSARLYAGDAPDFNNQIAPLFAKYCTSCHNGTDREGKLVLESYASLLEGGKRGGEIVPGNLAQSRLVRVLTGETEPSMPPKDNDKPKPEEIALIKRWVEAGAKGPQGAAPDPTRLVAPRIAATAPIREPINAVACSPDGRWIAVARYGRVELLSAENRKLALTLGDIRGNVNDVVFSADSTKLAAAAGEAGLFGEARLWNVADGKLLQRLQGHRDSIYAVALSPEGKTIATGSYDQQIKLWNTETGAEIRTLVGHNGAIHALAFHPQGKLLASASGDRTAKLWDVASGERLETFGQPLADQYTIAFSPDGQQLSAAGVDNRIRVWQISASGKEGTNPILFSRFAHENPIVKLVYSTDGKMLASSSEDGTLKIWNAGTLEEQRSLDRQPDAAPAMAFLPGGNALVVGRMDGTLAIYDTSNGKRIAAGPTFVSPGVYAGKSLMRFTSLIAFAALPLIQAVDAVPEQAETEPNDSLSQANHVAIPVTIMGTLDRPGDVDYFKFDAAAGQTLVFDVTARSIKSKAAPRLALLDAEGKLLSEESLTDANSDPLMAYKFTAAGKYVVRIDDRMMAGGKDHAYRLSIGAFAYVLDCFPPSVPANATTEVELIGPNIPVGTKVKVQAGAPGEATVPIDGARFRTRREIKVIASDLPEAVASMPNDSPQRALPIAAPGSAGGRIHRRPADQPPEANYYRFESKAGQKWIIETNAARRGSPIDTRIDVLTVDGRPIERLLLQAVRDSYINFKGIDSGGNQPRLKNWEEMELNQYVYLGGEVCKLYRAPQGPDSDFLVYRDLAGRRRPYFDTTATDHPNFEPVYVVEPHPPGTKLPDNGLPVFPIYYSNDDDSQRKLGRDSRLLFTAPAEGSYLVRVVDVRGEGGDRYIYRLTLREPKPDFNLTLGGADPMVNAGSGKRFKLSVDRVDYFDGEIRVDIGGLPPGVIATTPIVIQAGHLEADGVINALESAPPTTEQNRLMTKITATARIDGRDVTKTVTGLGQIKLAGKPKLLVHLSPAQPTNETVVHRPPRHQWIALDPTSAISRGGATLTKQSDHSLLAGGANPDKDSYTIVAPTDARNIRALRLEALGDKSLPAGAPGRADGNGNFVLTEFRVAAGPKSDFGQAESVALASATADYSQPGNEAARTIDGDPGTGWAVAANDPEHGWPVPRTGDDPSHAITFELKQPISFAEGTLLTFTLDQTSGNPRHNLGRFRLSVLADAPPELDYPQPAEVVISPGGGAVCKLRVERSGIKDRIQFDV
ncbi:MAG TPA: c-type cytochrome domain-containing protein, partial [Pirellulales bacterium]|nr:c-type cytochrome domain-containing protein [Pirellulales bacterium]